MKTRTRKRPWWVGTILPLFAVLIVGTAVRVWLWSHPLERLLTWTIADDGFYYFVIGQNIAHGVGSSFDGTNLTNGYHPLWMALNVLCFSLFSDRITAIRALLLLEVLFDVTGGVVLTYLAFRLFKERPYSLIIAALWLLNHRVIAAMQNGMETALCALMINLALLGALLLLEHPTRKRQVIWGLVTGLTVLARTDNSLLIGLLLLTLLVAHRSFKPLLLPLLTAALVTLPWFIWNHVHFHTIFQTSAFAITAIIQRRLEAQYGSPLAPSTLGAYLIPLWLNTVKRLYLFTGLPVNRWAFLSVLWVVGAAGLLARRINSWRKTAVSSSHWLLGAVSLWPILFTTTHVIWRWYFRPHYYASTAPAVILLFGLVLRELLKSGSLGRVWALLLVPLLIFSTFQLAHSNLLHHQEAMLEAARWLNSHSHGCTTVGSFNAGILGFFYEKGRVVNLDGVVNNAAKEAIVSGRLSSYTREEGICYLADIEESPGELLCRAEWGKFPANRAEVALRIPCGAEFYVIYQIDGPEL